MNEKDKEFYKCPCGCSILTNDESYRLKHSDLNIKSDKLRVQVGGGVDFKSHSLQLLNGDDSDRLPALNKCCKK